MSHFVLLVFMRSLCGIHTGVMSAVVSGHVADDWNVVTYIHFHHGDVKWFIYYELIK